MGSLGLTEVLVGHNVVAGNGDEGGGEDRVDGDDGLRWLTGPGRVRTGTARLMRGRWWRRQVRCVAGDGARGGGVTRWLAANFFDSGERRGGKGKGLAGMDGGRDGAPRGPICSTRARLEEEIVARAVVAACGRTGEDGAEKGARRWG